MFIGLWGLLLPGEVIYLPRDSQIIEYLTLKFHILRKICHWKVRNNLIEVVSYNLLFSSGDLIKMPVVTQTP